MQLMRTSNWNGKVDLFDVIVIEKTNDSYKVTVDLGKGPETIHGMPAPGKGRLSSRWYDYELTD